MAFLTTILEIIDPAASHHMFTKHEVFTSYTNISHLNQTLNLAGGTATLKIIGRGTGAPYSLN
ncbi:hypothetical protein CROQUDRAFT_91411 [Cronartium quercuum f. sp. fusiforme G11]|uniref:Uncharacterized protein n=1 Tax=Cronartium quercuum f. sp. fusiforme G11 TaxID=708437 RepID=A0A9P6TDA9_9BASI|nr:hypothetical protein CROQUDRAFT_91411 [Cronartium quercuum f. sp. fusiforme G11]